MKGKGVGETINVIFHVVITATEKNSLKKGVRKCRGVEMNLSLWDIFHLQ